jgi:flagellar hook-associated protein 1
MNLNTAGLIAGTGLAATGRATQVVSSNIANALTPGFARREAVQGSIGVFDGLQGVRIRSVARDIDARLVGEGRLANGQSAFAGSTATALSRVEKVVGLPGEAGSLSASMAAFETALINATARPDSAAMLAAVVTAGRDLAGAVRSASDAVQRERSTADATIADDVAALKTDLSSVRRLDQQIAAGTARGDETNALKDERSRALDRISAIVPIREVARPGNAPAIVTQNGLVLLDGRLAEIGFTAVQPVTADMTLAGGDLSGLTVDDRPIALNTVPGLMDGGRLAASFALRDTALPAAQTELDALARDLIERVSDPAVDATRAAGQPALFTDGGTVFAAANEPGLAARLAWNRATDPTTGGALFRLRDGLGAVSEGPVGDGGLLARLAGVLGDPRGSSLGSGLRSAAELASEVTSRIATRVLQAERDQGIAEGRATVLADSVAAMGVNSDAEMQRLLALEQAYAANARVLRVVDEMFAEILRVT